MLGHESEPPAPPADSLDDVLDAGLRAAFGGPADPQSADAAHSPSSILPALEETLGIQPRVLLRATGAEPAPVAVPTRGPDDPGRTLGRYQVAGEIARGGAGVILRGRDPDLGRDVAIKVLHAEHLARPGMAQRFVEEAQIAAQLQHPGILPVYELGVADLRRPYFSMKLIQGRTLAALLAERSRPSADRTRWITVFEQACQAVAFAHAKGVVHRDLKPSNIMVGGFGEVQVVDWGLAKVLSTGGLADEQRPEPEAPAIATVRSADPQAQSVIGSVLGTPAYMSPEQAAGALERVDERSDVFALGAILCEILTGLPPFTGERRQILERARTGDMAEAMDRLAASEADPELVDLARRCLSPQPSQRPRDAGAVAREVAVYLAALADRARTSELAAARAEARAQHERKARRWTLAVGTAALLALCGLFASLWWVREQRRAREGARSAVVNADLDAAAVQLGQALAAPPGDDEPWTTLHATAQLIQVRLAEGPVDTVTGDRVDTFLADLAEAQRDRRLIATIEDIVIRGATHSDAASWIQMEKDLRQAFLDYGIDLQTLSPAQTAERIRPSHLSAQLTDGLELWLGTRGSLASMGVEGHGMQQLLPWVEALYAADPDPFATRVRQMIYGPPPTPEQVRDVMNSVDFAAVRPRTLAWLSSAAYRSQDLALVDEILRRALLQHPGDLMLNFDCGYAMMAAQRYEKAIRAFERCLAIRPQSAGLWRSLGVALRHKGELESSADALRTAIAHQPAHGPTHLDLGLTLEAAGDLDGAAQELQRAIDLDPNLTAAREALQRVGAAAPEQ